MKGSGFVILATCILLASPALPGWAQDDAPSLVPDALQPAVAASEAIGMRLQRLDRAAWIATDAIQSDRDARKLRRAVRGWITEDIEVGTRVSFFDESTPSRLLYAVDVERSGRPTATILPEGTLANAGQQAMIRARNAASSQTFLRCSRTYNTVVFPVDDGIHAYLMASTTKPGIYPAGGHHLFVYDADGTRLESSRGFTRSCIDLGGGGPADKEMAAMFVTHILDPHPTEIHVFISLNAPAPLMVATSSLADPEKPAIWAVNQGRISLVGSGVDD